MGERAVNPVAIFDRDGTIIDIVRDEETGTIASAFHPDQLRFLPRAVDGMRALQDAGFLLAIATNQPGPAKGQISVTAVERTNAALVARLAIEGVRIAALEVCMHHPDGGPGSVAGLVRPCDCRKPKAGMLHAVMSRLGGDPARSWMIGDSITDLEAGRAAALATALIFAGNRCELCLFRNGPSTIPDASGPTLLDVATIILRRG
jgi:D-glycero-D-manno-heptose 1,7-bisphosphate phosphatase